MFCSFRHGELMAKKWLDSTEKQKKEAISFWFLDGIGESSHFLAISSP